MILGHDFCLSFSEDSYILEEEYDIKKNNVLKNIQSLNQ